MKRGMKVHRSVRARIKAFPKDGEDAYLPKIRCWIKEEKTTRELTRKEWLAERPDHFVWVDWVGVLGFMFVEVTDSGAILEDVSRRLGLSGDVESWVGPRRD
jgi:hypothetical protein